MLARKQLAGAMVLFLAVLAITVLKTVAYPLLPQYHAVPPLLTEQTADSTALQVDLGAGQGGVYFFEEPPSIAGVLKYIAPEKASIFKDDEDTLHRTLRRGDRLVIEFNPPAIQVLSMEPRVRLALGMPIDVNSATVEDLALLSGIGPATAGAIVSYRDSRGGLSTLSELKRIPGIGKKRYEAFQRHLVLDRDQGW